MNAHQMVEEIKTYGLDAPDVFEALLRVPRDKFVASKYKRFAYDDRSILIGGKQTISQPYTVAFMTSLLCLSGGDRVLEIGTGSGYQTAVLSLLAGQVFSVERIKKLAKAARSRLARLGYENIFIKVVKDEIGWEEKAPYDAILVTAGLLNGVSKKLLSQLKTDGIMIAPVGSGDDKEMVKFIKKDKEVKEEKYGTFHFVPYLQE